MLLSALHALGRTMRCMLARLQHFLRATVCASPSVQDEHTNRPGPWLFLALCYPDNTAGCTAEPARDETPCIPCYTFSFLSMILVVRLNLPTHANFAFRFSAHFLVSMKHANALDTRTF